MIPVFTRLTLACWLATLFSLHCYGDVEINGENQPIATPKNYAVLDISQDIALTPSGPWNEQMPLDDNNQCAFAVKGSGNTKLTVYTWKPSAGSASLAQTISIKSETKNNTPMYPPPRESIQGTSGGTCYTVRDSTIEKWNLHWLSADGVVYGNISWSRSAEFISGSVDSYFSGDQRVRYFGGNWDREGSRYAYLERAYKWTGGKEERISIPQDPDITPISKDDVCQLKKEGHFYESVVPPGDSGRTCGTDSNKEVKQKCFVESHFFEEDVFMPDFSNGKGSAIGCVGGQDLFCKGKKLFELEGGAWLNNQNQIIGFSYKKPDGPTQCYGACLFENGSTSYFNPPYVEKAAIIPQNVRGEMTGLSPFSISNPDPKDGSIRVLLSGNFRANPEANPESGWVQRYFVWQREKNGQIGTIHPLTIPDGIQLKSINANGLIAATGTTAWTSGTNPHALLLFPADIGVDANRDGVVKFAGNASDSSVADKPLDTTTESKPYRFWVNDDDDSGDQDHPGSSTKDSDSNTIVCQRDLEDFTRLWINVGGMQDAIANGSITVGLEWRNVASGGAPSIKIFAATESDGGTKYLSSAFTAANQIGAQALGTVTAGSSFKFPISFWQQDMLSGRPILSAANPNRHLLFEGGAEGKGQLIMTIWKGTQKIGEGPGVWLDIKNIKKMYVRAKGTPEGLPTPYQNIASSYDESIVSSAEDQLTNAFDKPADEEAKVVVFVNGSNEPSLESMLRAETMFKRLWWQGYKGRFAYFRWDTLVGAANGEFPVGQYNENEWRAWTYGNGLKDFVAKLPSNYTKNITSHSLGAGVVSSALQKGMKITNYAILQGALPAGCYDTSDSVNSYKRMTDAEVSAPTPDSAADQGYRGYLSNVTGKLCNLYNEQDYALATGVYAGMEANWEKNQIDYKPDSFRLTTQTRYVYDQSKSVGSRCYLQDFLFVGRQVTDVHEAMAFVARSRSKAVGALGATAGKVGSSVNLNSAPYNFGSTRPEHSAEFNLPIQQSSRFYNTLGIKLEVITPQNP